MEFCQPKKKKKAGTTILSASLCEGPRKRDVQRRTPCICVFFSSSPFFLLIWSRRITCKLMMCVCACQVVQSCPTLCDPVDYSPRGSSVHRILQTRVLEYWRAPSSRGSTQPRGQTHIFCTTALAGRGAQIGDTFYQKEKCQEWGREM